MGPNTAGSSSSPPRPQRQSTDNIQPNTMPPPPLPRRQSTDNFQQQPTPTPAGHGQPTGIPGTLPSEPLQGAMHPPAYATNGLHVRKQPTFMEEHEFYYKMILENIDVILTFIGHTPQNYKIPTKAIRHGEQVVWMSYVLTESGAVIVQGKEMDDGLSAMGELYLETCLKLDELMPDHSLGALENLAYWHVQEG